MLYNPWEFLTLILLPLFLYLCFFFFCNRPIQIMPVNGIQSINWVNKQPKYISQSSRYWEVQDQVLARQVSFWGFFSCLEDSCRLAMHPNDFLFNLGVVRERGSQLSDVSYKGINPIFIKVPPPWLPINLIISQRPHIQMLPHSWSGFQRINFGGT